jgi:hypothetical protein
LTYPSSIHHNNNSQSTSSFLDKPNPAQSVEASFVERDICVGGVGGLHWRAVSVECVGAVLLQWIGLSSQTGWSCFEWTVPGSRIRS